MIKRYQKLLIDLIESKGISCSSKNDFMNFCKSSLLRHECEIKAKSFFCVKDWKLLARSHQHVARMILEKNESDLDRSD